MQQKYLQLVSFWHTVAIGIFIYGQHQADDDQRNTCKKLFHSAYSDLAEPEMFMTWWTSGYEILPILPTQIKTYCAHFIHKAFWDLTPSDSTKLEHVGGNVDVEDLDQCKVHVHSFQAHPHEGGQ